MKIPRRIKTGDQVAIISTARAIDQNKLEQAIEMLESWGLEVVTGSNLHQVHHQFAGTDEERAADLQNAINDPKIRAIICFRGGYGSIRLMDLVDFSPLENDPKWLCGYSDVTALHNKMHQIGVGSVHSTMPVNFDTNTSEALATLKAILFEEPSSISCAPHPLNRVGTARGQIVGGNLSMIYSTSGTDIDLDTQGKILILEDLDEYLYHVDRMMQNLKRSGKLSGLTGLIVGGMTDMNDNTIPFGMDAETIIQEVVKDYSFPVCFGFPLGHIDDNRAVLLGGDYTLTVNDQGTSLNFNA